MTSSTRVSGSPARPETTWRTTGSKAVIGTRLASAGACLLALMLTPLAGAARSSTGVHGRTLTLYAVAEQEQFINNADDRARGEGSNPFGNYNDVVPAQVNETAKGPFPGDEALYSFNMYRDAALRHRAGAAVFTCQYGFAHTAYCDASYTIGAGALVGDGELNFDAQRFSLAVIGGSGPLASSGGQILVVPAAGHAERVTFHLDGS